MISRRQFLASTGLAALLETTLGRLAGDAITSAPDAAASTAAPSLDEVNVLQGTDSNFTFSKGNTLPIAALPFGMAHWTLQSNDETWLFQPQARRLQGLRCTHQLSPWLGDYGHALFFPFSGDIDPDPAARSSSYRPEDGALGPVSLRLLLLRYRVRIELVPTERCGLLSCLFEERAPRGCLIEAGHWDARFFPDSDGRTLRFSVPFTASGRKDAFAACYVVRLSAPWQGRPEIHGPRAILRFKDETGPALEARIGTSFISFEQAELNLDREIGRRNLPEVRAQGSAAWNEHLRRIETGGASKAQRRTFASCFYRALLFPRCWHEYDATGAKIHRSPYNGSVESGPMYADHGYWDLYRAWYPWMSLFFPDRLGDILAGWVNAYHEGGWLPQFPAPGYRACMTGSLIDAVFADAAVKDVRGFDLAAAYEGMRKHATQVGNPDAGYGRRGLADYLRLGYAPADRVAQSVAETCDSAYGDFCVAQIARLLGRHDDSKRFLERSRNWRHLFDPGTGFLRGRNADGSWVEPFEAYSWGSPYVEGSAWQHRFDVPHDVAGLFSAMGAAHPPARILESMLRQPAIFHAGAYRKEIHEMSEMAAVDFGQYAHSNQPVHHVLYLFAHAGRPDRTRYWTRRILGELYSPDIFPGDEDTGSMSAWYLMSALGFYPVCPGKAEYTLGAPLFSRAAAVLPQGRLEISARQGAAAGTISLNGRPCPGPTIAHSDIVRGGQMAFA